MRVRYTRRARSDLAEIFSYIAADNPEAAKQVARAIGHSIGLVAARPLVGIRNIRDPDIRSKLVARYRYRIHYSIRRDEIVILAVWHTSRRAFENEP